MLNLLIIVTTFEHFLREFVFTSFVLTEKLLNFVPVFDSRV